MVKNMVSALKASGCPVDITRDIQCEMCQPGKNIEHAGGYDAALNQVFICANNADNTGHVHGALVRHLIQMFDACVNKYDFQNAEHLACTEVRKANLANCGYLVHMQQPWASVRWQNAHAECVRNTAVDYMIKTKFVKPEIAEKAVDKVFDKCYLTWMSGAPWSYDHWGEGEPNQNGNEDCLAIDPQNTNYGWMDLSCAGDNAVPRYAVCEKIVEGY